VLKATVPSVFLPKPGTALWIMIRRERCFVFPVKPVASRLSGCAAQP
jgi:iron(III) transport system ATP-binding protein